MPTKSTIHASSASVNDCSEKGYSLFQLAEKQASDDTRGVDSGWEDQRGQLLAIVSRGERSKVARLIGISVSYFHGLLDGKKTNPSSKVRVLLTNYLKRPGEAKPAPSPRTQAVALLESIDDDLIEELLKTMQRHIAQRWRREDFSQWPKDERRGGKDRRSIVNAPER